MSAKWKRYAKRMRWPRKRRCPRRRRGDLRGHRGAGRRRFPRADQGRTGSAHLQATTGSETGDTQGRGHQSPRPFDSRDPRSGGARGAQAHLGADLRGRLSTGIVWIPTKKSAHEAVDRVAQAIVRHKTRVIDFDLRSYFGAPGVSLALPAGEIPAPARGMSRPTGNRALGSWR